MAPCGRLGVADAASMGIVGPAPAARPSGYPALTGRGSPTSLDPCAGTAGGRAPHTAVCGLDLLVGVEERPNPCTGPGAPMRLYRAAPTPAASPKTRAYPSSLTDAEWNI